MVMDAGMAIDRLKSLAHLDIDAVGVYEEVLERVDDEQVRRSFETFKDDHARHADRLSRAIADLGGTPPERKPDLAGRLAEWFGSLRAMIGSEGPVKAMHTAEQYHVKRYTEALGWDLPGDLPGIVESFYDDERRHLAFTEERLKAAAPS
ncbi:MAG: ferritin-like domain-containing protein [Coriobacteriia bacterium]|nr:ferritin-like domain-containing protein [Coriobacteriia bacterium]